MAAGKRKFGVGRNSTAGKGSRHVEVTHKTMSKPKKRRVEEKPHSANDPLTQEEMDERTESAEEISKDFCYNQLLESLQSREAFAQRRRDRKGGAKTSGNSSDKKGESEQYADGQNNGGDGSGSNVGKEVAKDDFEKDDIRSNDAENDDAEAEDEQAAQLSGDESEENEAENRMTPGEQAGEPFNSFKHHMEHTLMDDERASLAEGKVTFHRGMSAAGLERGTWVFSSPSPAPEVRNSLATCGVKKRLQDSWRGAYRKPSWGDFASEQQGQFYSLCNSYQDILHTNKSFRKEKGRGDQEDLSMMDAYVFHILNHILKTRDLITKNNEKLHHAGSEGNSQDPPRDQGYTRPKVLVLLPFRSVALKFMERLLKLAPSPQKSQVEHKERFFNDFGVEEDVKDEISAADNPENPAAKPADFRALFGGNSDDHFRIGIKFTRKSIKLYSEFYSSDIILASPLGLVTRIGEAEVEADKETDFLSSIEIAVVDYTDVILMQNWAHVVSVFEHLNRIPSQQHGTDFMRIREWYLNGLARHYRQTIVLGAFTHAGVNALFHRSCANHAGKVKTQCEYDPVLNMVAREVNQVYYKFDSKGIQDVDDMRFEFFVKQEFPKIRNTVQGGTMIFVRSYLDFVRLRNFFKSQSASFCLLGEYTKQSNVSRARTWFFHGQRQIMLYTERAHFFNRFKIRGIKNIIFYSLPEHAHFFTELLNMFEGGEVRSCSILISLYDKLQLERIVGTSRARKMLDASVINKVFTLRS